MIYLDNAASTWPKPESVVRRCRDWFGDNGANPGRSAHRPGTDAAAAVRETRERVARLLGTADPARVALTPGATFALNTALRGLLRAGDHVVTTVLEHNSVLRPLHLLREERGIAFTAVEPGPTGLVDPEAVVEALRPESRLVALTHASNILGGVQPVAESVRAVREARGEEVAVLVDAAQTAGVVPLRVEAWDVDLLAVAGHKGPFGLQGTGALYVREGLRLVPLCAGGTGTRSHEPVQPTSMPDALEAGTLNTPGIVSLGEGIGYLLETGVETVGRREFRHLARLLGGLRAIEGVTVYNRDVGAGRGADGAEPGGTEAGGHGSAGGDVAADAEAPASVAVALFNLDGVDPEEVAYHLDLRFGMAVRAGVHCAPWAHRWLGTLDREPQGAVRASPGFFTTDEEIDRFLDAARELVGLLRADPEPAETP